MMSSLGKFELIEELNSGSMGTVYAARDSVLDRRVAVKIILPGSHLDAELKERFYREARACARLHHPSIVTIYDFGEEQGTAYIAMELLSGTDVRRIIQERRPLPLDVKLELGAMVAEGVEQEGQYALLRERGCDLAQGFWLGYPVDAAGFAALLRPSEPRGRERG